jgi:predicted Co/Zn/Cd cation transporter (cation efflux family)
MRWPSIIFDVALTVVVWAAVLMALRQRRARMAVPSPPDAVRSRRLHEAAAIAAAIGVTCFFAWFITDATGPRWLHTLSGPAALAFIAAGAVGAGYAAWIGRP